MEKLVLVLAEENSSLATWMWSELFRSLREPKNRSWPVFLTTMNASSGCALCLLSPLHWAWGKGDDSKSMLLSEPGSCEALARQRRKLAAVAALTSLLLPFLVDQVPFLSATCCRLADTPLCYRSSSCAQRPCSCTSISLSLFFQHVSSFSAAVSRSPKCPVQVHSFPITPGDYWHLFHYRALQQGTGHLEDISQSFLMSLAPES